MHKSRIPMLDGGHFDLSENRKFAMVGFMGVFNGGQVRCKRTHSGEKHFTGIFSNLYCFTRLTDYMGTPLEGLDIKQRLVTGNA